MVEDPKRMCQLTSLCVPLVLLYTIIYLVLLHLNYNASRDGDWSSVLSADLLFVNTFFLYHRMTLETCESRETPHLLPISVLLTHPQTDSAIQQYM